MSACLPRGILAISIDLEVDRVRPTLPQQRSVDETTHWLLNVLDEYQLPATWALTDPAAAPMSQRIASLGPEHDIAILGDSTWVGRRAGRSRFGRELARRTVQGRGAGVTVSTLVLNSAELDDHFDLAIKHGITAVRQARGLNAGATAGLEPQTLRYGLWSFGVSLGLPGDSRWLPGGGGARAARAGIERAIAACRLFQLVIDAPQLSARGHSARRVVQRVLQHAQQRRSQGVLDVETLRSATGKLSNQQQSRPSRSILRPAA